jgi:hypothetical protein
MLLRHFIVLCSKNRYIAKLANLTVIQYLLKEGFTPCFVVVLQITASKTN